MTSVSRCLLTFLFTIDGKVLMREESADALPHRVASIAAGKSASSSALPSARLELCCDDVVDGLDDDDGTVDDVKKRTR